MTTPAATLGGRVLALTALLVLIVGVALSVVGWFSAGQPAGLGAAIATVMVLGFFGFGAVVLQIIARIMPAAALLIALVTYTLQVVLIGLVFVIIKRSGLLEEAVDPRWLGASMILLTMVWIAGHVRAATTARIPIYDLPERTLSGAEANTK